MNELYHGTKGKAMDDKAKRISVREASEILGLSPDYIHYHMRLGDLPIGHVMKSGGKSKSRRTYLIYLDKVNEFIGKTKT